MDIGLLLLRLVVGLTVAAHGGQKLFGWFGGPGIEGTARGLELLGFSPGRRHAVMAGLVEIGAGSLLALGLLTPVAAALVASVMVVAAISVHLKQGFFITAGGFEYTLVLGAAGLVAAFTGPGRYSLDAALGFSAGGVLWGLGALLVGIAGAVLQLSRRRVPTASHAATAA
jgi:putative oxidoreductase